MRTPVISWYCFVRLIVQQIFTTRSPFTKHGQSCFSTRPQWASSSQRIESCCRPRPMPWSCLYLALRMLCGMWNANVAEGVYQLARLERDEREYNITSTRKAVLGLPLLVQLRLSRFAVSSWATGIRTVHRTTIRCSLCDWTAGCKGALTAFRICSLSLCSYCYCYRGA